MNDPVKHASIMEEYAGRASIGHTRYATCGASSRSYAQPFERRHGCKWKWFAFAFNGQLTNFAELRQQLLANHDYHLTRDNDTEVIMHYIAHEMRGDDKPDLVDMFRRLAQQVRRRVQPRLPQRHGGDGGAAGPARHPAAVLRRRWSRVRRGQRERRPLKPRFPQ